MNWRKILDSLYRGWELLTADPFLIDSFEEDLEWIQENYDPDDVDRWWDRFAAIGIFASFGFSVVLFLNFVA